jgi:hypothetical protein
MIYLSNSYEKYRSRRKNNSIISSGDVRCDDIWFGVWRTSASVRNAIVLTALGREKPAGNKGESQTAGERDDTSFPLGTQAEERIPQ